MQIRAGEVEKGMFLLMKGSPYQVVEREFVNPGKGSSFVRLKLKHLTNGSTLQETQKTQDQMETAEVAEKKSQYLYKDDNAKEVFFMENENYEQFSMPFDLLGDKMFFLFEGETYPVVFLIDSPVDLKLPPKMDLEVVEAEDAVKGDTVSTVMKNAILSTGLKVRVPAFIKVGDKLRVNTETQEYVERINK
jgi:elongation factor P